MSYLFAVHPQPHPPLQSSPHFPHPPWQLVEVCNQREWVVQWRRLETFRDCTPWDDWKFRAAANGVLLGSAGNEQVLAEGEKMRCFNKRGASSRHFS